MANQFLNEASALAPYLQEIFFQIHKNPELGRKEYKTQALILSELEKLGIEAETIADTGVVATIRGKHSGKTVAFRADMDALPIQEDTELPYKSQNPGVMHACGHDAHVTILLGAAKLFAAHKDELNGNIKLFFQPDEEGFGGAQRMIEAGCMENPHVDAVFGCHVAPGLPVGTVSVKSGPNSAASNPFTVTFRGKGAHGASPHLGNDVIVAASQAVVALQTIVSRRTAPTDSAVVTIGSFQSGTKENILPETAILQGMIRTLTPETREKAKKSFLQIVSNVAEAMDVEVDINLREGYMSTTNDEAMTTLMRASAEKVFGSENVRIKPVPGLGTEDFGYFAAARPGCFYSLGVGNAEKGYTNPLHNPRFIADPAGFPYGSALFMQIAEDFLKCE